MKVFMVTMDQEPGRSWDSMPQGVLQAISNSVPWSNCLSLRLVCRPWSAAIRPLIRHIRVHVASGCSNTAAQGPPPGQLLHRALARLPCVTSIELVLTCHTLGSQLKDVLNIVGSQEQVAKVWISEVPAMQAVAQSSPRDYATSLQLLPLRRVSILSIRSPVTWSLQDIWDQVCCKDIGQGVGFLPALESLTIHQAALSSQQQVCDLPFDPDKHLSADISSRECNPKASEVLLNLKHLVTPLPGQKDPQGAVTCTLAASHDSYLRGLAAGLPSLQTLKILDSFQGNTQVVQHFGSLVELYMCVGDVLRSLVDPLEEELAFTRPFMSIKQLQCLDLRGAQSMKMPVKLDWLTASVQLRHLTACIMLCSEDMNRVRADQLQSLCALYIPKDPKLLAQIAAVGQGLTALTLSTAGTEAFGFPALCFRRNYVSLQPHLEAFRNLHTLSVLSGLDRLAFTVQDPDRLWRAMPSLRCLRLQGVGLGYTLQGEPLPDRHVKFRLRDPKNRHECLALAELEVKARDLVLLWMRDLPRGLQQLQLSRYLLVLSESVMQPISLAHAGNREELAQQGIVCHVSCHRNGMQSLVLAGCMAAATVGSFSKATDLADGVVKASSRLEGLLSGSVLADSKPLQVVVGSANKQLDEIAAGEALHSELIQERQQQHFEQVPPSPASFLLDPEPQQCEPKIAVHAGIVRLVEKQQLKQLQELQLLQVSAPWGAASLADSCQELQRLRIIAISYDTTSRQDRALMASSTVQRLAAAGLAGGLQQLTQLELDFGVSDTRLDHHSLVDHSGQDSRGHQLHDACGIGALRLLCNSLTGLKHLKLALDLDHCSLCACASDSAEPSTSCTLCPMKDDVGPSRNCDRHHHCIPFDARCVDASIVFKDSLQVPVCTCKGPWLLSNWGQLQILDITILVPFAASVGDFGPGVLGRCCKCGGGLGREAVRCFVKHVVPDALPACKVLYQEGF